MTYIDIPGSVDLTTEKQIRCAVVCFGTRTKTIDDVQRTVENGPKKKKKKNSVNDICIYIYI